MSPFLKKNAGGKIFLLCLRGGKIERDGWRFGGGGNGVGLLALLIDGNELCNTSEAPSTIIVSLRPGGVEA